MQAWLQHTRRIAIALGLIPLVVCLALGYSRIGWGPAQGFLGGLSLGFVVGYGYQLAASRQIGARAILVARWITTSQAREWAEIGAGRPMPTSVTEVDDWLAVAPHGLTTDLWAGGYYAAFGATDRARTFQRKLMEGDDASRFHARRLELAIALREGEPIDVAPLRAAIAELSQHERWRALGTTAILAARAATAGHEDVLAVFAGYYPYLPPDPVWRRHLVRVAIGYAGLIVLAGIAFAMLFLPLRLDAA